MCIIVKAVSNEICWKGCYLWWIVWPQGACAVLTDERGPARHRRNELGYAAYKLHSLLHTTLPTPVIIWVTSLKGILFFVKRGLRKQFCADCIDWRVSVYIPRLKTATIFKNGSVWKLFPPSLSAKPWIQSSTKGVVILDGWDAGNTCRGGTLASLGTWQVYQGEGMKSEAFSVFQRTMMDLKKKIKLTIYPKITR